MVEIERPVSLSTMARGGLGYCPMICAPVIGTKAEKPGRFNFEKGVSGHMCRVRARRKDARVVFVYFYFPKPLVLEASTNSWSKERLIAMFVRERWDQRV